MKKIVIILMILVSSSGLYAQSNNIVGKWITVDENGQDKSIVEIFKKPNGLYYGKILKLLIKPENENCIACKGDLKNKPLVGLEIINGLKMDDNSYSGGTITDPKSGKTYKCTITRDGNKLNVRGYVGFSALGRTQVWKLTN